MPRTRNGHGHHLLLGVLVTAALLAIPLPTVAQTAQLATDARAIDRPNDDGTALLLTFALPPDGADGIFVSPEVLVDGEWLPAAYRARKLITAPTQADFPEYFGWYPATPEHYVLTVDRHMTWREPTADELQDDPSLVAHWEPTGFAPGETYEVRLVVGAGTIGQERVVQRLDAGSATTHEEWFSAAAANNLVLCALFAFIIMGFILAARRNPNLFIRRIQGLEAVDEAIGRATEMGKPILHLNGLDPLSTLSTIAAVNILGRIARRVANYDSTLLVPCFDPVVMTVSQEVVKNAYIEAGRPDAYREDNIYFLTDQQFSYVASVCGIMVRQRPAANFMLGYFYAESLVLAETGYTTGAIQIAGTDALAQLPFFITTCDYTLIGEELYAASAYLSREPMLLGSLKGQDVGKAFVMLMVIIGSILATIGVYLAMYGIGTSVDWVWLSHMLTPLT